MGYTIFLHESHKGRGSKRSLHFGTTLAYYLDMNNKNDRSNEMIRIDKIRSLKEIKEYNAINGYEKSDRDYWTLKKELVSKLWYRPISDIKSKLYSIKLFVFNHKKYIQNKKSHEETVEWLNSL